MESPTNRLVNERDQAPSPSPGTSGRSTTPEMPIPYNVCAERLNRLKRLVETFVDASVNNTTRENSNRGATAPSTCVPEFRPNNPIMTSYIIMQNRLGGHARSWFNSLNNINLTWNEWKDLIVRTFPEHHDFASVLRRQVNRTKLPWETWDEYYFEKCELLRACHILDRDAVSCIIDGMNSKTIETGAKAGRYTTPESLYAEYISTLANDEKRRTTDRDEKGRSTSRGERRYTPYEKNKREKPGNRTPETKRTRRCYNCHGLGHGHNWGTRQINATKQRPEAKSNCASSSLDNKCYYVLCEINGHEMSGYIDPGCSTIILLASRLTS
ncbi:hypothetical protein NQ315_014751 [Exocentrus adspersus]|uniref:Retrotransposon gag domain-containing protein n=1 Tax=Exocentrus adspersus TaxID=1586481 RepID=A0AAV8VE35_9CUCU|nr:hypothetical protein NQ315_014751 [Exocentrus adspersus]